MSAIAHTVLYEQAMRLDFLDEVNRIPGGEALKTCIQCGTCSGSCPVSWAMEESPRQVMAMVRAGMRDRVLDSTTIWTCASCYSCSVRCPRGIRITDIMYILKRAAIRERRTRSRAAQALSRAFVAQVNAHGRNHEPALMVRFMLAARPLSMPKAAPIGFALMRRGRLPLRSKPIRDLAALRRIVARAEQLGGE